MGWLDRLLGRTKTTTPAPPPEPQGVESDITLDDPSFEWFMAGWEYEIRAGHTAMDEIRGEILDRFREHFPFAFGPATEARLLAELTARTEAILAREEANERTWMARTLNDELSAAFATLRAAGLVALENTGVSIQDGWAYVGLKQRPSDRGAVFYHQQDVLDLLQVGDELLLAFGSFDPAPEWNRPKSQLIGREVLNTLHAHGLDARWSGKPEERIRIPAFGWGKRRWTEPPPLTPVQRGSGLPVDDLEHLSVPATFSGESLAQFVHPVTARYSSAGFDVKLSTAYRGVWKLHGGVRGQLCHWGTPHAFVRAGEQTELCVRNAYLNLELEDADALRTKGFRIAQNRLKQA